MKAVNARNKLRESKAERRLIVSVLGGRYKEWVVETQQEPSEQAVD